MSVNQLYGMDYRYIMPPSQQQTGVQTTQGNTDSIYTTNVSDSQKVNLSTKDGKDDGKIGFFEKIGSFIGGAVKSVGNAVKDILTDPGKLLKTAAIVGACFIPVVGPIIAGGLAVVGAVKGVQTIAQGAQMAAAAETDEQARMAWENMGAGTLQVGLCAVPAGKALRGAAGAVKNGITAVKNAGGIVAATKGAVSTAGQAISTTRSALQGANTMAQSAGGWGAVTRNTISNVKTAAQNAGGWGVVARNAAGYAGNAIRNNAGEILYYTGRVAAADMEGPNSPEAYYAAGPQQEAYTQTSTYNMPYYAADYNLNYDNIYGDLNRLTMQQRLMSA